MTKTSKAATAATLADIGAAHERATKRADLIGAVMRAQQALKQQKEIQRELIARRVRNLDAAIEAAAAAGIDVAALAAEEPEGTEC